MRYQVTTNANSNRNYMQWTEAETPLAAILKVMDGEWVPEDGEDNRMTVEGGSWCGWLTVKSPATGHAHCVDYYAEPDPEVEDEDGDEDPRDILMLVPCTGNNSAITGLGCIGVRVFLNGREVSIFANIDKNLLEILLTHGDNIYICGDSAANGGH